MKGNEDILIKRAPLHKIQVQSGTLLEPIYGFKVHQKNAKNITGNVSYEKQRKRVRSSDEGDPYREGG